LKNVAILLISLTLSVPVYAEEAVITVPTPPVESKPEEVKPKEEEPKVEPTPEKQVVKKEEPDYSEYEALVKRYLRDVLTSYGIEFNDSNFDKKALCIDEVGILEQELRDTFGPYGQFTHDSYRVQRRIENQIRRCKMIK
jgi:hypothetical protein